MATEDEICWVLAGLLLGSWLVFLAWFFILRRDGICNWRLEAEDEETIAGVGFRQSEDVISVRVPIPAEISRIQNNREEERREDQQGGIKNEEGREEEGRKKEDKKEESKEEAGRPNAMRASSENLDAKEVKNIQKKEEVKSKRRTHRYKSTSCSSNDTEEEDVTIAEDQPGHLVHKRTPPKLSENYA